VDDTPNCPGRRLRSQDLGHGGHDLRQDPDRSPHLVRGRLVRHRSSGSTSTARAVRVPRGPATGRHTQGLRDPTVPEEPDPLLLGSRPGLSAPGVRTVSGPGTRLGLILDPRTGGPVDRDSGDTSGHPSRFSVTRTAHPVPAQHRAARGILTAPGGNWKTSALWRPSIVIVAPNLSPLCPTHRPLGLASRWSIASPIPFQSSRPGRSTHSAGEVDSREFRDPDQERVPQGFQGTAAQRVRALVSGTLLGGTAEAHQKETNQLT